MNRGSVVPIAGLLATLLGGLSVFSLSGAAQPKSLADHLRELDTGVIVRGKVRVPPLASMVTRDVEARLRMAEREDTAAWRMVKTKADWERFRDQRLAALRKALGPIPPLPADLNTRVTGRHDGPGYTVENLVYRSRPGLWVTANLYLPAKPAASMPALLLCHSHSSAKHTGARQDMAMTWARAGCLVLVPDHLGHGERRQHPFGEEGQHNYHGRYDLGMQLHLAGESLMGWLVRDLMCGVEVLLSRKGVDPERLMLISEPAGGGDVAAVTAAREPRIKTVMVQNFGGPQPETPYPLPRDAEQTFPFAGFGSWESTRNLRLSARDGFLPWMIVASVAPRRLIYYHEFYWDKETDPVWKRLQRVYSFYDTKEALVGLAGSGFVVGSEPENSHWLPINRVLLYPTLERWLGIPNPKAEFSKRRPAEDLLCLKPGEKVGQSEPVHEMLSRLGKDRIKTAEKSLPTAPAERREELRRSIASLLGDVNPVGKPIVTGLPLPIETRGGATIERIHLRTEPAVMVPMLLVWPSSPKGRLPVVVCCSEGGKQEFLRRRAEEIAKLIESGVAVCLPDVRGTGESAPSSERGRRSPATAVSASEWMLGQSRIGGCLRDLRSVLRYLADRPELNPDRVALWGDSFAPVNAGDRSLVVAHNASDRPRQCEPLGGLLAILGALYEDKVKVVYARGSLSDYLSALQGPQPHLPHDAVIPGILLLGDLGVITSGLAPKSLWLDQPVDGLNRAVSLETLQRVYAATSAAYSEAKHLGNLRLTDKASLPAVVADWLVAGLRK